MIIGTPRRRTNTTDNSHETHTATSAPQSPTGANNQEQDSDSNASDANSETPQPTIPQQGTQDDEHTESWPDFIRRCTHEAEALLRKLKIVDWITQHKRRKWHLARDVMTRDKHKWSYQAISWQPTLQPELNARRTQSRPRKRWADDIMHFLVTQNEGIYHSKTQKRLDTTSTELTRVELESITKDVNYWNQLENAFVKL